MSSRSHGLAVTALAALVLHCSSGDSVSGDSTDAGRDAGALPRRDASVGEGEDDGGRTDSGEPVSLPPSDDFEAGTLDSSWTLFHSDVAEASVGGGALTLHMTRGQLWYNASTSALLYKHVTGDFKVTSRVHARKASDPTATPDAQIHLGGLMARDPHGSDMAAMENYVFIVVGFDQNDVSVETKSTTDNRSDYMGPTWPSGDAELRLCRFGSTFTLYKRAIGDASFTLAATFERPDLPATLQVGPNAYAQGGSPDLSVHFDEVTFAPVSDASDCAN